MKAIIPVVLGLALAACQNEPSYTDSNAPAAPENSGSETPAPKAGLVSFEITGMT